MSSGKYIVIEGPPGTGKSVHAGLLATKLQLAGLPTRVFNEPSIKSDLTSNAVQKLIKDPLYPMNTKTEVLLYSAARSQSLDVIKRSVQNGLYCIVDKNYLTTLINEYYSEGSLDNYDNIANVISFATGGVEPDLTIVLDAPADTLSRRLSKNPNLSNEEKLDQIRAGYLWEANQRNYPIVYTTGSLAEVSNDIWKLVTPTLAKRDSHALKASEVESINSIIDTKRASLPDIEPPTHKPTRLEPFFLQTDIQSRQTRTQVKVEGVSFLAAEKIRRLNITKIISLSQAINRGASDSVDNGYNFTIPENLSSTVKKDYANGLSKVIDSHDKLVRSLASYLNKSAKLSVKNKDSDYIALASNYLKPLLPVSTKTVIGIYGEGNALEDLSSLLINDSLLEIKKIGSRIASESDKNLTNSEPNLKTSRKDLLNSENKLNELAKQYLPGSYGGPVEEVATLLTTSQRNELDILENMAFKNSNLPMSEIRNRIASLEMSKKESIFRAYIERWTDTSISSGSLFDSITYDWEIVSSFEAYSEILNLVRPLFTELQDLTPRYGYNVPKVIEDASLGEDYDNCFDISMQVYSMVQSKGFQQESQYATLLGHRARWLTTLTATDILRLYSSLGKLSQEPRSILDTMIEKVSEIHPLISENLIKTYNKSPKPKPKTSSGKKPKNRKPSKP